jgi:hypothetical protein
MRPEPTESGVSLGLLGPVELRRDGVVIPVGAAQKRMILATLGLNSGEVVSTDRLIDAVWGERPSRSAGKALQLYVSQLVMRWSRCGRHPVSSSVRRRGTPSRFRHSK